MMRRHTTGINQCKLQNFVLNFVPWHAKKKVELKNIDIKVKLT